MDTATAIDWRDCTGYLRFLSVEAANRGDVRDPTVIMDELLARVGAPSLSEPLQKLRAMAASVACDGA